jgi:hypothetical protein
VTLVGYSSDPRRDERAVQFKQLDGEWRLQRHYDGDEQAGMRGSLSKDGVRVVRGISGEAVAVLKEPGERDVQKDEEDFLIACWSLCTGKIWTLFEPICSVCSTLASTR